MLANIMFSLKCARNSNSTVLLNLLLKNRYSRRSDKSASTYKVVKSQTDNLDDVDGAVLGINSNWELLTPRGFRFYLPGSVGPGWLDATTTAQVRTQLVDICDNNEWVTIEYDGKPPQSQRSRLKGNTQQSMLRCVAQECPLLLRKGIEELFPGCLDVGSPQLTIVSICQKTSAKSRWSQEMETEELAKCFVLAASDICSKLKMIGYWADFINPFSGQPHLSLQKNSSLYKTDERFRCLGFKILHKNNCKVILYDNNVKTFIGSLYTTAPASTAYLKEILHDCELVDVNEA